MFEIRDVIPSREIIKLLSFIIFFLLAFFFPWEKLYASQDTKGKDKLLASHQEDEGLGRR